MDADRGSRAVCLVTVDAVDVDDPLFAIDLSDLSFSTLVFPSHDQNLVVLSYWDGANLPKRPR